MATSSAIYDSSGRSDGGTTKKRKRLTDEVDFNVGKLSKVDSERGEELYESSKSSSFDSDAECEGCEEDADTRATTPSGPKKYVDPSLPCRQRNHQCNFPGCDKTFVRLSRLVEHSRSHTNSRIFVCPYEGCGKDFLRDAHLQRHVKSAHTHVRDNVCSFAGCGKAFATGTRLRRHEAAHEKKEGKTCPYEGCSQVFRKHQTVNQHIALVHDKLSSFRCEKETGGVNRCTAVFTTPRKLSAHERRVHGQNSFSCSICADKEPQTGATSAFLSHQELVSHMRNAHPPECPFCELKCSSEKSMAQHVDLEHGSKDPAKWNVICPEPGCGRAFAKKGNLNIHIKTVHQARRDFACGQVPRAELHDVDGWETDDGCGEAFTSRGTLEAHVRAVHLGRGRKWDKKHSKGQRPKASSSGKLTGTRTGSSVKYAISCPVTGCNLRFSKPYDRDVHLTMTHGLADFEVQMLEEDVRGPKSALPPQFAKREEDFEAEAVFDQHFRDASLAIDPTLL